MKRDEAQYLLSSYRSSGRDKDEEAFKEALELTLVDEELAEWFVKERVFDSRFAESLNSLEVPEELRAQLLDMADPSFHENDEDELGVIGALASIEPPSTLRAEVLNVMKVAAENKGREKEGNKWGMGRGGWFPLAMAATIGLGLYLGFWAPLGGGGHVVSDALVKEEALRVLSSEDFSFDYAGGDYYQVVSWAEGKNIPTPASLPASIQGLKTMGCKELLIQGKKVGLICFHSEQYGMLHLVVLEEKDASPCLCDLPGLEGVKVCCKKESESGCTSAQWKMGGKVYMLLSFKVCGQEMQEFF